MWYSSQHFNEPTETHFFTTWLNTALQNACINLLPLLVSLLVSPHLAHGANMPHPALKFYILLYFTEPVSTN